MSFPYSFSGGSSMPMPTSMVYALSHRSITVLNSLLYEKAQELESKSFGKKTAALTVNEITQSIIQAYAAVFESRLGGDPSKPTFDILKDRELTVAFHLKGSTVLNLIEELKLESIDLDTTLDFSKIPIPCEYLSSEETIRAFFSSPQGRVYLRDFYVEVSHEATKRLLLIDNEKTYIKNQALKAVSNAEIPLKTAEDIELLKDKFFNNLLLFAGNSTFLITFGSIDFAIKVPFMHTSSCVHKADSLEIQIPIHPLTCHLLAQSCSVISSLSLSEALEHLTKKTISIADPSSIQHNGFERIVYALTQGWSSPEKDMIYVLLEELVSRTSLEKQVSNLPFERLYALLRKKYTHQV